MVRLVTRYKNHLDLCTLLCLDFVYFIIKPSRLANWINAININHISEEKGQKILQNVGNFSSLSQVTKLAHPSVSIQEEYRV